MKFGAKSAWSVDEIEEKLKRETDGIEIQLLTLDPEKEMSVKLPDEYIDKIQAVHTPLVNGYDYPIDGAAGFKFLLAMCEHMPFKREGLHIICHHHGGMFKRDTVWYEDIVMSMRTLADKYPWCVFCIENPSLKLNKWDNDNVLLVKDIDKKNVYTCLDTCHALIAERVVGVSLEDHFRANKDICRHVHLCNAVKADKEYGRGKGHGVPFSGKDDPDLKRIIDLYRGHNFVTDVVYEVREDDYLNCVNYSLMKDMVGDRLC